MSMMIHAPAGATRQAKRLGRGIGSGTGKTSGKGHKGQNARSGGSVRPGFEGGQMPLFRRIAKRGFSNYRFKTTYVPLNLDVLSARFAAGETVDIPTLREKRLIGKNVQDVKVLGRGEIEIAVTIRGLAVSAGARKKIEAAGGTVETVVAEETEG
ncbi:MAG: 50S ribosomal protein L15 [Spirochaeta sp.]|jgi:large subunit ribosomal protein L15|nr:50S ribosomal protein L15 [Spirochaeta sp.]